MAQTRGGGFSTIAMILAFLAIGGFLYWLSIASEPAEVVVAEEETQAQPVALTAFSRNPPMYQGTQIRVEGVPVQRLLGDASFLAMLPDSMPYVVTLDPSLLDEGVQVVPGVQATIVGTVEAISDSLFQAWVADSLFIDQAEIDAVAAAGSRFMAEDVLVGPPEDGMETDTTGGAMDDEASTDADAQP